MSAKKKPQRDKLSPVQTKGSAPAPSPIPLVDTPDVVVPTPVAPDILPDQTAPVNPQLLNSVAADPASMAAMNKIQALVNGTGTNPLYLLGQYVTREAALTAALEVAIGEITRLQVEIVRARMAAKPQA